MDGYYVYHSEPGTGGPSATYVRSSDLTSWEEVPGYQELVNEPWASIGEIGLANFTPYTGCYLDQPGTYFTFDNGDSYTLLPTRYSVQDIVATEDAFYICQSYMISELSMIDLAVENPSIDYEGTPGPDAPITVQFDITNLGLVDYNREGELKVTVMLAESALLDASSSVTLLETTLEPPLAVGESLHFSNEVLIPRDLPAGDFHLGVFVDSSDRLAELNERNNIYFSPDSLNDVPHVTLTINQAEGGSVLAGSGFTTGAFRYINCIQEMIRNSSSKHTSLSL